MSVVGTDDNFRKAISYSPILIHFSGHGYKNELENFPNNDHSFHSTKGDVIVLEEENGLSRDLF